MRIDVRSGGSARHRWHILLWLLPVLLLLGVARLAPSPDLNAQATDGPAVAASPESTPPLAAHVDHSSVKWEQYPIEPAQPEQSVAAYERQ
jgi:hypothetical protein